MQSIPETSGMSLVIDGVFSMEGDLALVPDRVDSSEKHGARLMIDDAHELCISSEGDGTAWHNGLIQKVDLIMSTFSKRFASLGGFVTGDVDIIDYVKHHAESILLSASSTPAQASADQAT
jgi:8-amino-7-oxononanoate synthase